MAVVFDDERPFEFSVPVVIIGAGACGLIAALAARDAGAQVLVLERDRTPSGSTALSSGFIPASCTRFQRQASIVDTPERFAADVLRKNHGEADSRMVEAVCRASGPAIDWLAERHRVPFIVVDGFLYPGHSALRMHAVPERTGRGLMAALLEACARAEIDILSEAQVTTLIADHDRRVRGVAFSRPDGSADTVGCGALVLACCGFGGNHDMVLEYIPEIAQAQYFGHAGNRGDAVKWGLALGAGMGCMGAYQGHGSVATPHGVLITWALMMEGGIQVNGNGERFSNEHEGYSEQCVKVLAQPGQVAWNIYDERLHRLGMTFDDYREATQASAVKSAADAQQLAGLTGIPRASLARTLEEVANLAAGLGKDNFGRDFTGKPPLVPPYRAIKVTGALFHTQGGLLVDEDAQVLGRDGRCLPNLFAGGGAACGVSGSQVWGYLSGNGLLSAVTLGRQAGLSAARLVGATRP